MSDPFIEFEVKRNEEGVAQLSAQLHSDGLSNDDIRLRFARRGILYARQVAESGAFPISEVSAGDEVTATITFTQSDTYGDGDEFYESDKDGDDSYFFNSPDAEPVDDRAIGFRLKISHLNSPDERPFGWAASPAVMAATQVSKMVRVAIEQAAGVSVVSKPAELSAPGL